MTEEEFWAPLLTIFNVVPVFYRLYYNDDGSPIIYSMEELPHAYVEVDLETYLNYNLNVKVIDGQLVFKKAVITVNKLQPTNHHGKTCDPRDVCVVIEASKTNTKWILTSNEIN